ncbi:hypothetical protein M9Y10_039363 [Tritrichomonas musculus]|uniref:Uncharacterized protein n=1 Tax=Tritrichomonas musculus TaxID=1915356 RepID=A0ABR2KBL4_9EUKA
MTKKESQNKPQIVLSRSNINSFVEVTIPAGTTSIAINENYLTDFVGLNSSSKLEYLSIDKNPIISFRGFPSFPNLTYLSLIDTPISKLSNFRALAICVAGQQLKTLNGVEVSTQDRAAALAYGPTETTCQLIIRGWLPKKPISLPARKAKNNTDNNTMQQSMKCRILKIVDEQENDPISVRITRVLRAQGYGIPQIRDFLHEYFSPHTQKKKEQKQLKDDSSIEAQIKKQQQIIDVLAAQLHALRSGNRTFNDYDEMIRTSGINLLRNAEILKRSENDQGQENDQSQENIQSSEFSASKSRKKANKPEYELLRSAVIDFLQVAENTKDNTLIKLLDSITLQTDQDDQEDQEDQYQYQYQYQYQGNQEQQQEMQEYESRQQKSESQEDQAEGEIDYSQFSNNPNQNNNNTNNNNNEFTEDEIMQYDDDYIPRPSTRNIIADMDEKEENLTNSQIQIETSIKDEEEEKNGVKSFNESEDNLNETNDKGINVPENIIDNDNASDKEVDENIKTMLARMDKFIYEEEGFEEDDNLESNQNMLETDSNQPTDDVQPSS